MAFSLFAVLGCSISVTFARINLNLTTDEESLLEFKSRIISDPSNILARNWTTSNRVSFCFWIGVSCGRRNKRIIALELHGWNLEGTVAPHLGNLTFLRSLDLSLNSFKGRIPEELFGLRRLELLNLGANNFTGTIPLFLGALTELEQIFMENNSFTGVIPHLSNLSKLEIFSIRENYLYGTLPQEMGNLSSLQILITRSNQLTGSIPYEIFNILSLQIVDFTDNSFTGIIPMNLCGNLSQLNKLGLSYNNLSGVISSSIYQCKSLEILSLSINEFNGSIPKEIGKLTMLEELYFGGNNFEGAIPKQVGNLTQLKGLDLADNKMTGEIPSEIGNLKLEMLSLAANALSGSIPASIFNISTLTKLQLSFNPFRANNLIGGNPNQEWRFISSLANCPHLEKLELSSNQLKGTLPTSLGNLSKSLWYFEASDCHIKGSIPPTIGNLTGIKSVNLDRNELTGLIPKILGELTRIERLYLGHNRLKGNIPTEICRLNRLSELYLSDNILNGTIPTCFGDLKYLSTVFLDSNRLTSVVPNLWNIPYLLELDLSTNFLSGNIPSEIPNLKSLQNLDLSWNHFSGDIPINIGFLQSLEILSFAHNNLKGSIPNSTGDLRGLVSLNLSHNNISGYIPKSLESLMFLSYLDLSYNRLEGEIPKAGPFSNFTAQSFTMNYALCGDVRLQVPACHIEGVDKSSSKHVSFIKYILAPTVLAIFAVSLSIWILQKRKANKKQNQVEISSILSWRRISYHELRRATEDFSEVSVIGRGSFGSVYKGTLSDGLNIAVKVFNMQLERAIKSFAVECETMSTIRHKNLVRVISCCSNIDFKALVLEYMPNGSLEKWLYSCSPQNSLDLQKRLNIAIDTALALEYLHHGIPSPVIHCDLKPSNILIDEDMIAHVGDFGISKLFGEGEAFRQTITLATIGYMAPEYGSEGKVSTSCDVYSYGITLLELFTSKKPTDGMFTEEMSLNDWVRKSLKENIVTKVVAAGLLDQEDHHFSAKEQCVLSIFDLAMKCLAISPHERINMIETVVILKKILASFLANRT